MKKLISYFVLNLVLFSIPFLSVQASATPISKLALSSLYQGDDEDDEEIYIPDWIEDNQQAMEYFIQSNIAQMFVLYPGELPYEEGIEGGWGDEGAQQIEDHMDFMSVTKWLQVRDQLRKEYADILREVTECYEAGELGPDARFAEYYKKLYAFENRMWELWGNYMDEYHDEYHRMYYEYKGFWQLSYGQEVYLQDNSVQTGAAAYELSEGYGDLGIIAHRDRPVVGYSISLCKEDEDHKRPQAWALYGYYSTDGNFPGDPNSPEWKFIDARSDYDFPAGDSVTVNFDVARPGIYNHFYLRMYRRDDQLNERLPSVSIQEFRFIDGDVQITDDTPIPDPELPKFMVTLNEVEKDQYFVPRIAVKTDIGTPSSPFRFRNRRANAVFHHINPDAKDYAYQWYSPLQFDENGELTVRLQDKEGWNIFKSDEVEGYYMAPGHICDVYLSTDVVEKATGRNYTLTDTIPFIIAYPKPTLSVEDNSILTARDVQEATYKATIKDLDDEQGFSIKVEVEDYANGSRQTRVLEYEFEPSDEFYDEADKYVWYVVPNAEWLRMRVDGDKVHECRINLLYWANPKGEDVKVTLTATNTVGEAASSVTKSFHCDLVDVENGFSATYKEGFDDDAEVHDITEWRTSNKNEIEAFKTAFDKKDTRGVKAAHKAWEESLKKTISYSAPAIWGPAEVIWEDHYKLRLPAGDGKFYVGYPGIDLTETFTLSWPNVGVSKTLSYTSLDMPDNYYVLCPTVEDVSGTRSITVYYTDNKGEGKSVTEMGNFGSEEEEPDYLFIKDDVGIRSFAQMLFRDNSSQAIGGFNRFFYKRTEGTATYFGSGDHGVEDLSTFGWKQYGYNYWDHRLNLSSTPQFTRYIVPLERNSLVLEQTPIVRLQLMEEDGTPIDDPYLIVRTATITQPAGSEAVPLGTTQSYSAIKKGVEMQANKLINGVLEIPVEPDPDGGTNHVLIEIAQYHWSPYYQSRLFSEFTDPEAFTNYINKGLPYPCVIRRFPDQLITKTYDSYINTLTTRSVDEGLFSNSRTPHSLDDGTDMGYEGQGKSYIDMLVGLRRYNAHHDAEFESGSGPMFKPEGSTGLEENWNFNYGYKLFSAKRAANVNFNGNPPSSNYEVWRFAPEAMDDVEIANDDYGRPIYWPSSQTGFNHSYAYMTCRPISMIEDMRKSDTTPHSEIIGLGEFNKSVLNASGNASGNCKMYYKNIGTFYNTATEEIDPEALINSVAGTETPGYDGNSMPSEKSTDKISGGLKGFSMSTPSCLPFANILVTSDIGEYRIRSSFELNALDFIMPQNEAMERLQKIQTRVNDVSNYLQQFLLIKNSCLGDYTTDIFNTDDGVFLGFKGFVEMAVIKDHKANKWTPYFTGFGAKAEASAQFTWKMQAPPFIAKMVTRGEMSSSFMMLNPHPKDFVYQQSFKDPQQGLNEATFNPYSHFNIYVNSTFDLQLCLQAGIGFDAGFIAAHGGLMGKARAAARFAYVDRPYLTGNLRRSAGSRFDLEASLSAYAYFKFLFLKYTKEWPICGVSKTYWSPDNNWNPLKSDPNLRPELLEEEAKVRVRPLTAVYAPLRRRVSVIGSRTISDNVDIFANPIYMNGGSRLALFNINNPSNPNDDRVIVSGENCNIDTPSQLYGDDVPSFAYDAASAGDHQIVAVQRLSQQLTSADTNMEAADKLTDKLQIVASVGNNTGDFKPTVISPKNSANQDPKAAIAQNGSAAVVWASGEINVEEKSDGDGGTYSDPSLTGNLVLSEYITDEYGEGSWTRPAELVGISPLSQVKDYAIATGGKHPIVMASVPGISSEGDASAPVMLMTVNGLGIARRTNLGIEGAQHQLCAVYENGQKSTNHFVASCIVNAGEDGKTDIQLFDITMDDDGTIHHNSLGRLGLDKYRILSYRLVSPKNGATGVDGLGIIWNQHEQENTDDETLDAVAYNRTYVARINRRGDYIYLSHAAQALDLPDEESVADMTAYMDYDEGRECPVVTAAFCVGETQKDGASTAASILEKKVSLNNEIKWLEESSGLSNIIDRKNGTEIKLAFRNIGLHTIRKFHITMAGETFEQSADVAPSASTTVTVKLPAKTDFSNEVPFTVTADFYDIDITDPNDSGVLTGQASTSGAFKVNVVDFVMGLSVNRLDKETKRNVVSLSIANLSPMALKPGNTVKVSLFTDALGDTQYPGVATYSIPANQLYDATTKSALVKTIRFFVNAPETRTTVYAICQTVDSEGNVVFDQNTSDNMVIVSLAPSKTEEGGETTEESEYNIVTLVRLIQSLKDDKPQPDQDYNGDGIVDMKDLDALQQLILKSAPDRLTVDDLENPQLKVRNAGDNIEVEGLNPDKDLKVFDATGQLINWTEPNAEKASVKLSRKGTVIVVNDGKAGVIRH